MKASKETWIASLALAIVITAGITSPAIVVEDNSLYILLSIIVTIILGLVILIYIAMPHNIKVRTVNELKYGILLKPTPIVPDLTSELYSVKYNDGYITRIKLNVKDNRDESEDSDEMSETYLLFTKEPLTGEEHTRTLNGLRSLR